MSPTSRAAPSPKSDVGGGLTGASSSYAIFFHETQAKLRLAYPNLAFGELSKLISAQWCSLNEVDKKKYRQKATQARRERLRGVAFSKLNELVFTQKSRKPSPATTVSSVPISNLPVVPHNREYSAPPVTSNYSSQYPAYNYNNYFDSRSQTTNSDYYFSFQQNK